MPSANNIAEWLKALLTPSKKHSKKTKAPEAPKALTLKDKAKKAFGNMQYKTRYQVREQISEKLPQDDFATELKILEYWDMF
jgi:hypothetical protein